jgi:hypothetical protein
MNHNSHYLLLWLIDHAIGVQCGAYSNINQSVLQDGVMRDAEDVTAVS